MHHKWVTLGGILLILHNPLDQSCERKALNRQTAQIISDNETIIVPSSLIVMFNHLYRYSYHCPGECFMSVLHFSAAWAHWAPFSLVSLHRCSCSGLAPIDGYWGQYQTSIPNTPKAQNSNTQYPTSPKFQYPIPTSYFYFAIVTACNSLRAANNRTKT